MKKRMGKKFYILYVILNFLVEQFYMAKIIFVQVFNKFLTFIEQTILLSSLLKQWEPWWICYPKHKM